jgi:hypothetical protein
MDRYQFNKNYDEWKVSRARLYDAEKLAKLVNLNINSPDNSITEEVPDKVTSNLLKRELSGYLKSNSSEAEPASFKENLNKNINKYKYLNSFWVNLLTGEAVSAAEAFPGEAAELWNKTLADLKTQVNQANYRIWLEKTEGLGYLGSDFLVRAGSSLIAGYLDANLRAIMEAALARTAGQAYRIELIEIADNGTLGADQVNATYPNYSKLEGKK